MGHYINLRVKLLVKLFRQYITETIYLACSQSGISSIKGYVKRTSSCSHNCIFCGLQKCAVLSLPKDDLIPNAVAVCGCKGSVKKDLAAFFRQSPFHGFQTVHCIVNRFYMKDLLLLSCSAHYICRPGPFCPFHSIYLLYRSHIFFSQTHGSYYLDVHQLAFVVIGISRVSHVW